MCELSVNDGKQQREHNDGDSNLRDDWNDKTENWVQNELTDGHTSWNNRIWHRNRIQDKLTGGHNI